MRRMLFILLICFPVFAADDDHPTTFVFPTYYHTYGIHKAGPFELFLFLGLSVQFSNPQGLACVRLDVWDDPDEKNDDDEVTVYGVNAGQNNIIFNKSMYALGVYGLDEPAEQLLKNPHGICANSRGDVYVADTGNHRIVRLFNPGDRLEFRYAFGGEGNGPGEFERPLQVALDNSGNIYVTDYGNNRVQVFDDSSRFLFQFSGNGFLRAPSAIAVTDSLEKHDYRSQSFIMVVDSIFQRISKFTRRGKRLKTVRMSDFGFTDAKLEYATLDYYNQLLITDSRNHCIHKFNSNLEYIISFGTQGDDDYQFRSPTGISIYRRFGQLFVAEAAGAQYYWVGTDIRDFRWENRKNRTLFSFRITEPSNVTVDILDPKGDFVRRVANKRFQNRAGTVRIFWDHKAGIPPANISRDQKIGMSRTVIPGKPVPDGNYTARISIEPTYSSRTYFERTVEYEFEVRQAQNVR